MISTILSNPSTRLRLAIAPAVIIVLLAVVWAFQPDTGFATSAANWRPFHVHPAVWVSLITGFSACVVSVWIWSLKPLNPVTSVFALSGYMTLLFTSTVTWHFMAAPIPEALQESLMTGNLLAASGFGIVMICLFLIYPGKVPYWRWIMAGVIAGFGLWTLLRGFGPWRQTEQVQIITFMEMLGIIAFALYQIHLARHDPRQRAIATWVGVSVVVGAGIFIALVPVPYLFGLPLSALPQYVFPSFLLIYAGLAVGLVRYRLFDLGGWAFQLIFHACVAFIVLVGDALLIAGLSLAPEEALSVALFGMAFLYMPMRAFALQRLTRRRDLDESTIFRSVMEAALRPSGPQRAQGWEALLREVFNPLEVLTAPADVETAAIAAEGLDLILPPVATAPSLIVRYPRAGRALFSKADLAMARHLVELMHHAEDSRGAYDRGVNEERTRIARDIHDNIGAQLLRALHSGAAPRKDEMIRDTLADLRLIINNAQSHDMPLAVSLADLRAETSDRLSPHGIALSWDMEVHTDRPFSPSRLHALRSLVREAISNTIKHAGATALSVRIAVDEAALLLSIEDNGRGFSSHSVSLGHGLDNMKARTESLGGDFSLTSEGQGVRLRARIPFPSPTSVEEQPS